VLAAASVASQHTIHTGITPGTLRELAQTAHRRLGFAFRPFVA